ncbi:hypothetical protein [Halomonas ramblicola]|uniref:hypothetical protein n=1 Tax=Halomonas ramblicola TaxID=747349 RepID=UPI0025B3504B|nr:hypothetical protein [Halomonas ramblicola]MDN3521531.1 hypothetical protein [Halomonas ramblicola]
MPLFTVMGVGKTTGRKRTRYYQALDANMARAMAEKGGTEVLEIDAEPLAVAPASLVDTAHAMRACIGDSPTHLDCLLAIMERAIDRGLPMLITMGTAWDDDMEEVPWRATLYPKRLLNSAQGIRIAGEVQPLVRYLITGDQQRPGQRQLLLERIEHAEPAPAPDRCHRS